MDPSFQTHLSKLQRTVYNLEIHRLINVIKWISLETVQKAEVGGNTCSFVTRKEWWWFPVPCVLKGFWSVFGSVSGS